MENKKFVRLNAAEFAALLSRDNVCILDSRSEETFTSEHIAGANRLHTANPDALILGTPKQRPILLYCYHGNASLQYANIFAEFGFAEVYDLIGGYDAWRAYHATSTAVLPAPTLLRWMAAQGFTGNDINATIANRSTPLMQAARLGELAIAEELIACGAALQPTNLDGNNALWLACFGGNVALVARLVAKGIAISHQNDNGATCLMYAASAGKTDVVACPLKGGADTSLKSLDDFTALGMAANLECLNLLRKVSPRQLEST